MRGGGSRRSSPIASGSGSTPRGGRKSAPAAGAAKGSLVLLVALFFLHPADALRLIETAMLLQPFPSSYFFETLGLSYFALGDHERARVA